MTRRPGAVLALLAFAQLIISLDYNIVYVALPDIGRELGFSAQSLQWVVSAYAVAFGGALLLGGRACDLIGPRRVFAAGCALYAGASLLGGLAGEPGLLVAARAGQGLGGALLFPATLTLVSTSFAAGRERNRAFAVWGTAGGSGMILGSLLGGVLTQVFGWAAVFFVNVPLAAAAAVLAFVLLPADPARVPGRRFDLPGALTATLGTTLVVFALVEGPELGWTSVLLPAFAGLAALAAFVVIERRSRDPLLPLRLLRERNLGTGAVVTFLYMGTFGTLLYFLTGYFQGVHGYGALATGLAFGVPMVAIAAGSQAAGRLATRYGTRPTLVVSLVVGGAGAVMLGLSMTLSASYLELVPALVVLGLGQGAGYTLMFGAAAAGIPASEQGIASGVASTAQQVGGTVGLAVFVAVANAGTSEVDGLRTAVLLAAAGIALTAVAALRFRGARPAVAVPA
ncbi:drug resistance transporter, EmrB/QacA subfamily [Amycolatopsis pretoriensis]|uniref:Drug resistance transporter, EmrB/QacA subfamily n=1 Tax=Amycolatopsis pretoriensis TaxID=218821 RepID=A0A1H5QJ23_9PSEU|nr:MFS transporter [Amycolatopsis pretoriensis]SEF26045.1 drug resistance transporter, EmrB/QacA subfamily [Amycolatopsis pretoriensis]